MSKRMHRQRGITLVEFALVAPLFFVLALGLIDFTRIIQANTTAADGARQGARQAAANQVASDQPFGAADANPCSGTALTTGASGHGCLTDARIFATVTDSLARGGLDNSPTMIPDTDGASCVASFPSAGHAKVCIKPSDAAAAAALAPGAGTPCANQKTLLGHDPKPGDLGGRQAEWTNGRYKGCFLIEVTVVYTYRPFTGLLQGIIGNSIHVVSSTSTVTEY